MLNGSMYNVINNNKLVLNLVLKQIIKNRNHTYLCVRNDTVNIENTRLIPIPISVSKIVEVRKVTKNGSHTYRCVRNDTVNIENTRLIPISVSKIVRSERSQRTEAIHTVVYVTTQLI